MSRLINEFYKELIEEKISFSTAYMISKKSVQEQKEMYKRQKELENSYARWEKIYKYGISDPNWEDGYNLNLVRNHIIFERKELEKLNYFPEIYNSEVPSKVDNRYMAREDEIRDNAKLILKIYYDNIDYKYLMKNQNSISKKEAESICLYYVIGYVRALERAIKDDNLVTMRLHEHPQMYIESFKICHQKLEKILSDKESK